MQGELGEHLDPNLEELEIGEVKRRSVVGVAALAGRTFVLQAVALVATFFLTVFLSPADYGVFFLVSAVVNFLVYFSDVGLAAALIQKKEKLSREELVTTFTVQQALVIVLLGVALAAAPLVRGYYGLSDAGVYLLWALVGAFFLSSLKTIPSVLLERQLAFSRLVVPQIAETLAFYGLAVYLAWQGWGVTSFTVAVLVRGGVGLAVMYTLSPWRLGLGFNRLALKRLLKFGLPYQANTLLAMVKDDGVTVVLGGLVGAAGVGFLGWAQKWAYAPLRFFMDQVIKVTFPAFSRLQHDKKELARAVEKSLYFIAFLVFPALVGLGMVAGPLTYIIPKYEKWQPALMLLYIYGGVAAWGAVTTPLTNALNAIGKIRYTFWLMVMWTGLTWILVVPAAYFYGIRGVAVAALGVATSSVVAIYYAHRAIGFSLVGAVGRPVVASGMMGAVLWWARGMVPVSGVGVGELVVVGLVVYLGVMWFWGGETLKEDAKKILAGLGRG